MKELHKYLSWFVLFVCFMYINGCPRGWLPSGAKCYLFSNMTARWSDATGVCLAFGGRLAEPRSSAIATFLTNEQQKEGGDFWIGVTDIIEEGIWMYISGMDDLLVTNWALNQPDGHINDNCVALHADDNGKWADFNCGYNKKFVCERDE